MFPGCVETWVCASCSGWAVCKVTFSSTTFCPGATPAAPPEAPCSYARNHLDSSHHVHNFPSYRQPEILWSADNKHLREGKSGEQWFSRHCFASCSKFGGNFGSSTPVCYLNKSYCHRPASSFFIATDREPWCSAAQQCSSAPAQQSTSTAQHSSAVQRSAAAGPLVCMWTPLFLRAD